MNEILINWLYIFAAIFALRLCWKGQKRLLVRRRLRAALILNEAKHLFIRTGKDFKGFSSLSKSDLRDLRRQRKNCVKTRTENAGEFSSVCACPSCETIDMHDFDSVCRKIVKRKCKHCNYEWEQR